MHSTLQSLIDTAWEDRAALNPGQAPDALRLAVDQVIAGLDDGTLRVSIGIEDAADLIDDLSHALTVASDVPVAVLA